MFEATILIVAPELTQKEYDRLLSFVSPDKQERIKRFRFFQDACNCLLGDILVRVEICRITGINMKQIEFAVNEYGKPFVVGNPCIHFNISHSAHYVAYVIADEPVGIDVELIKNVDIKIAERFFTTDEAAYIVGGQQELRFYEVWTKKESRIKWEGKGLHKPLTSFSIFEPRNKMPIAYHNAFQNEEVVCHICATEEEIPAVRVINTDSFMQSVKELLR